MQKKRVNITLSYYSERKMLCNNISLNNVNALNGVKIKNVINLRTRIFLELDQSNEERSYFYKLGYVCLFWYVRIFRVISTQNILQKKIIHPVWPVLVLSSVCYQVTSTCKLIDTIWRNKCLKGCDGGEVGNIEVAIPSLRLNVDII